jgi:organic hydroperoxide reductase OsmC/OhrA
MLAGILDSGHTPARELVVAAAYKYVGAWNGVKAIEVSVQGRVPSLDAARFETAAKEASERCRQAFGLGAAREIIVHSRLL